MSVNTPGCVGYTAALSVGGLIFGLLCALAGFGEGFWTPAYALYLLLLASAYYVGIPVVILVVLALIVSRWLRAYEDQRLHVLTAFAVPFLGILPFAVLLDFDRDTSLLLTLLPPSMASGRAAVIPLVHHRRQRFAPDPLIRVP